MPLKLSPVPEKIPLYLRECPCPFQVFLISREKRTEFKIDLL
jgi:hypothetical protein